MLVGVAEQVHPDRWDRPGDGALLGDQEVRERRRLQETAGHDQRGPGDGGRVDQPPGVGVELRDHGKDAIALANSETVFRHDGHGVQQGAAVAVQDTLRVARRPARVAERGRLPIVLDRRPRKVPVLLSDDLLVAKHLASESRDVAVPDDDQVLDGLELVDHLRQQRHEAVVEDDDAVLGVVDDVDQLFLEQAQVQSVEDRSHARDREVGLDVLVAVPHERRDPVALLHPEAGQHLGQSGRAIRDLALRDAGDGPVRV